MSVLSAAAAVYSKIISNSTLEINDSNSEDYRGHIIQFDGTNAILEINNPTSFHAGGISGFDLSNKIHLVGINATSALYSSPMSALIIKYANDQHLIFYKFFLSGGIFSSTEIFAIPHEIPGYTLTSDGNGGTYIGVVKVQVVDISTFLANTANIPVNGFAIYDTCANIAKNLDTLQANIAKFSSITQTDSSHPLLEDSISATQITNDAGVLAKIYGSYTLKVSDTAANLAANLDALQSQIDGGHISTINVSNRTPLSVTSLQATADASVLGLIQRGGGSYTVQVPTSGSISTFLANTTNSNGFAISDSSANIASNLDILQANLSKISSITLSGNNSVMAITATQLKSDALVLAKISGNYSLAVSATPASLVSAELSNPHVTSVSITDTAANFIANLSTLNAKVNSISSITITDSHVLGITASQQTADATLLSKIIGGYNLSNTVTLPTGSTYNAQANQTITGVSGLNKVVFSEPGANFSVSIAGSSATLIDNLGSFGTVTLNKIQRVQFNDGTAIALDFQHGQNAYSAAMIIGTAFGASKVPVYFAPGISLVDAGQSNIQIAATIQQLGLIESAVGSYSNTAWVGFIRPF